MKVTPERLAAFADGELPQAEAAEVAALVESDPALAEEVRRHRALKARLAGHFAPLAQEPVPDALAAMLRPGGGAVADFAAAARLKQARKSLPRWTWFVGPALAASLVLMVALPRGGQGAVDAELAGVLDTQLAGTGTAADPAQVLLSFRNGDGRFCRAFAQEGRSGIACRGNEGWELALESGGGAAPASGSDYRMAGSADVLAAAQDMAAGPALDLQGERQAIARGWRPLPAAR